MLVIFNLVGLLLVVLGFGSYTLLSSFGLVSENLQFETMVGSSAAFDALVRLAMLKRHRWYEAIFYPAYGGSFFFCPAWALGSFLLVGALWQRFSMSPGVA
jgi:hypothetical protein